MPSARSMDRGEGVCPAHRPSSAGPEAGSPEWPNGVRRGLANVGQNARLLTRCGATVRAWGTELRGSAGCVGRWCGSGLAAWSSGAPCSCSSWSRSASARRILTLTGQRGQDEPHAVDHSSSNGQRAAGHRTPPGCCWGRTGRGHHPAVGAGLWFAAGHPPARRRAGAVELRAPAAAAGVSAGVPAEAASRAIAWRRAAAHAATSCTR